MVMIDQGIYPREGIHSRRFPSSEAGNDLPQGPYPVPTQILCLDEGILQALGSSRSKEVGVGQREGECGYQALCLGLSQASIQLILRIC